MEKPRIGVYICHCGINIAGTVDIKAVVEYASGLPDVAVARDYAYVCSDPGQTMIRDDIRSMRLNRIVVAACSPRMHELTFQKTLRDAGLNPYLLDVANLREQCSWPHAELHEDATEKAKQLVSMSVARVALLEPLEMRTVGVEKACLVVGGGIAGIKAALELANSGFKVYLVERSPTIGGHMAQLDKVFPTLDCSACILTPMMVTVSHHPNIELLAYSEVRGVEGYVGNFRVVVTRKPRYVDTARCTGCGTCAQKCPVRVPDEFNLGLGSRKAIYVPFPQAVPLKYTIDRDRCLYFQKGVCRVCEKFCTAGAVDLDQEPEDLELQAGTIIVATGYDLYDIQQLREYGYGRHKNIIVSLQMERILNAAGPTQGKIVRPSDGKEPRSVAFILCAGSREDAGLQYCCRVGCITAVKQACMLKDHLKEGVTVYICYTDLRTFGKGHEEMYTRAREAGVVFVRGRPSEVRALPDGSLVFDVFDTITQQLLRINADMVVLQPGLVPRPETEALKDILKLQTSPDGFLLEAHPKLRPNETVVDGVFIAGTVQGPKDITDTVAHAGAAAATAGSLMARGVFEVSPIIAVVDEDTCSGCGKCVSVCPYQAISLDEKAGTAQVLEAKCKGCGSCSSTCPTGAIQLRHYRDKQVLAMIEGQVPASPSGSSTDLPD